MILSGINASCKTGIFTHINPDGDALGSSFGLAAYLESIGSGYVIFLPTAPGESLDFMADGNVKEHIRIWDADNAEQLAGEIAECDVIVGLDFNTPDRIGGFKEAFIAAKGRKLLIDHHVGPATEYFDETISDTEVSSTCELLYRTLKRLPGIDGKPDALNEKARTALLTGITTDTNNFANSVFPDTLAFVGEMIAAGTDRDAIIHELYFRYPERRIRAQGYLLDKVLNITGDGVGYMILDRGLQERFGLKEGDAEGFVNIPLSIEGVRMSIFAREDCNENGKVRISIRSKKGTSARDCAIRFFHGGGHLLASGGRLTIGTDIHSMDEAASYIEESTRKFFSEPVQIG